jgi:hypothetical protein
LSVVSFFWFVVFFPSRPVWHDRQIPPAPEFTKSVLSNPVVVGGVPGGVPIAVRRFAARPCVLLAFRSVRNRLWSTWHIRQRRFVSPADVPGIVVVYDGVSVAITWW